MKNSKKVLALLMALVMTLALCVTAFAAGSGSITIENATPGKEYKLYKVFDASYGAGNTASYTIDESSPWYNLVKNSGLFTLENTTVDKRYTVSANADAGADIIAWFNSAEVKTAAAKFSGVSKTADSATVKFENLDYGYYYISSTLGAIVTITNVDNTVTIIDKNQTPGWGEGESGKFIKQADDTLVKSDSADIGQTVNFVVKVNNALNYHGADKITEYIISDTPGAAIKVNENTIEVKVNDTKIEQPLWSYAEGADGKFTIYIEWQDDEGNFRYPIDNGTPNTIVVSYSATLAGNASVGSSTSNNTNEATLSWKFNTSRGGEDKPSTVKVHTFAIGVFKHNNNNVGLGGAVFELRDANNTVLKLYKLQSNGIEDIYYLANEYNKANTDGPRLDTDTEYSSFTTPDDGQLVIKGLKAGTYYLVEIEAPDGYNLLKEPVKLIISEASDKSEIYELSVDQANILNSTGTELPETGGIGTMLFIGLGALAVVGAGIFLVTNKRISKENF